MISYCALLHRRRVSVHIEMRFERGLARRRQKGLVQNGGAVASRHGLDYVAVVVHPNVNDHDAAFLYVIHGSGNVAHGAPSLDVRVGLAVCAAMFRIALRLTGLEGRVRLGGRVRRRAVRVYNIAGQKVAKDYKGLVIKNGKKMIQ